MVAGPVDALIGYARDLIAGEFGELLFVGLESSRMLLVDCEGVGVGEMISGIPYALSGEDGPAGT